MLADKITGIVGNEIILHSEVEQQYESQKTMAFQNMSETVAKCIVYEDLLYQKLLLNQAKQDSIEVPQEQVEGEIDRRIRFFADQIGSEQKLEEYYGKTILEIKTEFRDMVENQLLIQKMQSKITENIKVTPSDIRSYFENIPVDSLPFIDSELEVAHIVKSPEVSTEEQDRVREKIIGIRKRIINGDDFGTLAYLYSEDPLSAKKNGELGFVQRGALVPAFEAVAFKLKDGQVSEVVETQYGYHILQLIERRGAKVNVRHILLVPQVSNEGLQESRAFLDSLHQLILLDSMSFGQAAEQFSDDTESKLNNGILINPQTGDSRFEPDMMDPMLAFAVNKLKMGEVSGPVIMNTKDGKQAYRLLKLISRTKPHIANLKEDYQRIQSAALTEKQNMAIQEWVRKKIAATYIKLEKEYQSCNFSNEWVIQ
jgi:peptidyl-prolyl cis-trans isomerase SurA